MNVRIKCFNRREQDVVRLWRKSGLSQGSITTYLHWVRRFQIYCDLHGLDRTSELTLVGAIKFGSSYIGPRSKGPVGKSTRFAARVALHAWACAMHSLKIQVPSWQEAPESVKLSPLLKERPDHAVARRIFLRTRMPHDPLTSGAIRHRIHLYARRAGVAADVIGAHAFRHSHASRQIDAGVNPKVVGDILGHRNPSSTSVYVKVALRRLRMVALPVPG
jgi:hypothetical protein